MRICVLALAVVAACKPAPTPDDYFGTTVVPPRGLDKIKPGMPAREALAAQPAAREVRRGVLAIPSGVKDVELLAILDAKPEPVVSSVVARVTQPFAGRLRGALADRWRKEVAHDTWAGDTWRAMLRDDGTALAVEFWPAMTAAFWGAPGTPPAAIAKVVPGMMKHEIEAVIPVVIARYGHFAEDKASITFVGEDQPGGLNEITMFLDADHARGVLLKAWGEGETQPEDAAMRDDFADQHLWFSPSGWRATLHSAKPGRLTSLGQPHDDLLSFAHYVPTATLLGPGAEVAVLAASPFGKTLEELASSYPKMQSNVFALPPTELAEQVLVVFVLDAKAKVDTVRLSLRYTAKGRAALKAAFDQKWGAPTAQGVYHAGAPYVSAHDDGQQWELVIRPVAPPAGATVR